MKRRCLILLACAPVAARGAARDPLPMPPGGRPWRIGWLQI